jgi:hypothetical protein
MISIFIHSTWHLLRDKHLIFSLILLGQLYLKNFAKVFQVCQFNLSLFGIYDDFLMNENLCHYF